jgi:hypothetical protein
VLSLNSLSRKGGRERGRSLKYPLRKTFWDYSICEERCDNA